MGIRRDILVKIRDVIDGTKLPDNTVISATTVPFDPLGQENSFPRFVIFSEPETIQIGLFGTSEDRSMVVGIIGYCMASPGEELGLTAEDCIDAIIDVLTDSTNVTSFHSCGSEGGFRIIQIGPILNEHGEDFSVEGTAFISLPTLVQFTKDN